MSIPNNNATKTSSSTNTAYQTIEDLIGPTLYIKQKKNDPTAVASSSTAASSSSMYTIESRPTQTVLTKNANNNKSVEYVLLYFSASWCPPCQSFTPILADFYQQYSNNMEIIYISSDRNIETFEEYYIKKMPFTTLHPFDNKASNITTTLRQKLPHIFQITGIPTLIVLHIPPEGSSSSRIQFITDQGRMDILNNVKQYDVVWKKWKSALSLSIEDGVILSKKGDGSIFSIVMKMFTSIIQNPVYIFGLYYLIKMYGKTVYEMILNHTTNNNSTTPSITTEDPALFELVPDDEF